MLGEMALATAFVIPDTQMTIVRDMLEPATTHAQNVTGTPRTTVSSV